ncbi:hypothetical protein NW762_012054 [Fusarium torreyae]|uniref:Lysine-specific metallo-endopeptidase domain-containing protein n=1 Tax=Fusarium torreyae TaxID=1237075 RepID=A0A9W8RS95_9HYPO|nr:hypothetical protein NW762_012054 [Fusarium torreyae]
MSPTAFPSFFGLKLLGILALVSGSIHADGDTTALGVTDVFNVKTGTDKGGCDAYDVDQWYQDALYLAKGVEKALMAAQNADQDDEIRRYLYTYFRIGPTDNSNFVKMKKKKWTDEALIENTGVPDPDGMKIKQRYPDEFKECVTDRAKARKDQPKSVQATLPKNFVPFWMEDLKQYRYAETGNYCSKGRGAKNKNYAGTDDNMQPNVITFCPQNWKDGSYKKLDDLPEVTKEGVSIGKLKVEGLTLLHEMFHFSLLNEYTPDTAYTVGQIAGNEKLDTGDFITQEKALKNPESWAVFALAWDLGLKNPDYTFSNTMSKLLKKD